MSITKTHLLKFLYKIFYYRGFHRPAAGLLPASVYLSLPIIPVINQYLIHLTGGYFPPWK